TKRDEKVKELKLKKEEKEVKLFTNRPDNWSSYWAKLRKKERKKEMPEIRFRIFSGTTTRPSCVTTIFPTNMPPS
ncbi:MAG: hypothetical protein M0T74_13615, partial [Desulfitobacterium hafniense]|nr:hypothetical protein [Desulfitobacterium hafniense]